MKPGVYLRDWGPYGLELGLMEADRWYGRAVIETKDWIYTMNLDQWIYLGEF